MTELRKRICDRCAATNLGEHESCLLCGALLPAFPPSATDTVVNFPAAKVKARASNASNASLVETQSFNFALVIERGELAGKRFPLHTQLAIGRDKKADIYLADDKVSRNHALVEREGALCFLTDLNSTNGTGLNGVPISDKVELKPDDIIVVGDYVLRLSAT